ncbi:MAG: transglutaminase domain-containing protein [Pseudomonadota bacterium]
MLGWFLVVILIVFGSITEPAADTSCVVEADHPLIGEARWYGLYFEDRKIGHATTAMAIEKPADPDITSNVIVQRFAMTFKLEKTEETIEQTRRFDAKPPHRLLDGAFTTADRQITYQQRDHALEMKEDGLIRAWPGLERHLCDEEDIAVHRFLTSNPPIGARLETIDFDVEQQVLASSTHDLDDISRRKILGASHLFQTLRTESSSDVFSYVAKARFQNGEAVNLFVGPIELRAETQAIAHQPNQGVDLFAEFEKPLNRPLARLAAVRSLSLKATIDDEAMTIRDVVQDSFGQRVEYLDHQTAMIHLSDQPALDDRADFERFRRATSTHPADHPRIRSLVDEIKGTLETTADDRTLAEAMIRFVADFIEIVPESPYHYHTTSVFDILDNRTGDCTEHSQLFVTLARAAGLAAREVSGFVYGGNDQTPSLGGHAWVEVLIDGRWIGMDPTWEEVRLNKSHVQTRGMLVPSLAFEVIEIEYY